LTILVTGGAGYIGSHTCVELLVSGYDIIVVDNLSNSKRESINRIQEVTGKEFRFYQEDILDIDALSLIFLENKIDAVIHFAGLKAVGESVSPSLWHYYNNIAGTVRLCEVMKNYNVKKLVFSSSATVYGIPDSLPISEEYPLGATHPYGRTKQMIEELLRDLYQSDYEWSVALLRYFNPIGAHKSGRMGEDPAGIPNNLLLYISQVALGHLDELKVYGNDYPTKDGTGVRDYVHVADLAIANRKALEKVFDSKGVDAYNLGTGTGYSVLEMISAFEKVSGRKIPYRMVGRRPDDRGICYANPAKAKYELGWSARRGLEEMCQDSWRWQLNNPKGYSEMTKVLLD